MAGGKQFTMKARPDEGKDRPPPERVRRGEYRIAEGEDAGGSYAIDLASCRSMLRLRQASFGWDRAAMGRVGRLQKLSRACAVDWPDRHHSARVWISPPWASTRQTETPRQRQTKKN